MRRLCTLGLLASVVMALSGAGSALAASSLPRPAKFMHAEATGSGPVVTAAAEQAPLAEAAFQVHQLVKAEHLTGFTATEFKTNPLELVIWWSGAVPAQLATLIKQLQASVATALHPTRYSLAELDRDERFVIGLSPAQVGGQVVFAGLEPDFSALRVAVDPATTGDLTLADISARIQHLDSGIPKTVYFQAAGAPLTCPPSNCPWRWDDTPPYYGGIVYDYPSGTPICSTSFVAQNISSGFTGLLTDYHCTNGSTGNATTPGQGKLVGSFQTCCAAQDLIPITKSHALPNDDYAPRIYTGPWDARTSAQVVTQDIVSLGQPIYLSGGFSGETSNNSVIDTNAYAKFGLHGFLTHQLNGQAAAGGGDSGGPAYRWSNGTLAALGVIDQGVTSTSVPCIGNPAFLSRGCYTDIFSTSIADDLTSINAVLVVAAPGYGYPLSPSPMGDTLLNDQVLYSNQYLTDARDKFTLIQGGDGNLVLYSPNYALWYSNRYGSNAYTIMQGDGNLVTYSNGRAIWWSGTQGNNGAWLVMQGDGNLAIYAPGGTPIWWTGTGH